jgi:hypothetical protein
MHQGQRDRRLLKTLPSAQDIRKRLAENLRESRLLRRLLRLLQEAKLQDGGSLDAQ